MVRIRLKQIALTGMILGTAGMSAPIWAQSYETGGIQLRFGLGVGLEAASNRTLDPDDDDGSVEARTDLSFGLLTETRTQRFAFDASVSARDFSGGDGSQLNTGLNNPALDLAYARSSAQARLRFDASLRETDLADNALFFDEETGDFLLLDGSAIRRTTITGAGYNWGLDRSVGFGLSAEYRKTTFRDGVATDVGGSTLNDSTRLTLGATGRLEFDEARRLAVNLRYSSFDEDGTASTRETVSLTNTLTYDRPLGAVTLGFGITDTEDGTRYNLNAGRSIEMPLGTVSGRLGVTRGVNGDTFLSGALSANRDLPRGALTFALNRDISSGNLQDSQRENTSLRIGYLHELSQIAALNVDFSWADSRISNSGLSTTNATLSAAYSRALTRDWDMNLGYRHRYRDQDTTGSASSNELFLNLNRSFVTRF